MSAQLLVFLKFLTRSIDTFNEWVGRVAAWLVLIMVLIVFYSVITRYLFSINSVAVQELQWHLFALIFLLGAAYTLKHDEHVRVDIIYQSRWMNDRRRAWINLIGGCFLLIPFCLLVIITSYPFVYTSIISGEGSPDPGGLPYRFLLKAAIPIGFGLLMLQGIADSLTHLLYLLGESKDSN